MPVDRDDEEVQEATSNKGGEEVASEVSTTNKRDIEEGSSKDKAKKKVRKNKEIQTVQKNL